MALIRDLFYKAPNLSAASNFSILNGIFYMATGSLFIFWPGSVQTLFQDPPFVGNEQALFRVIGMAVAVIGWLYFFGGRSGLRQFVAASIIDRIILVPAVLLPLLLSGIFPHSLGVFAILDPCLGFVAWMLSRRN